MFSETALTPASQSYLNGLAEFEAHQQILRESSRKYQTTPHTCNCMAQAMNKNRRNGKLCKHIKFILSEVKS